MKSRIIQAKRITAVCGVIAAVGLVSAGDHYADDDQHAPAAAGGLEISWFTVDGGGGTSSGGDLVVRGTIGQPDAGFMAGGDLEFYSGYWLRDPDSDNDGVDDVDDPDPLDPLVCGDGTKFPPPDGCDDCGDFAEIDLKVALQGVIEPSINRCITLELWECPDTAPTKIVELDLTFLNGEFNGIVQVPCAVGTYTCITARDASHTLRRTDEDDFTLVAGNLYTADFTNTGGDDDSLLGGNLNDDFWIDIVDYAIFSSQFSDFVGGSDCGTVGFHADVSGDGEVGIEEFSYIQINFLKSHDANCCGQPAMAGDGTGFATTPDAGSRPVTRISVQQLRREGLFDLIGADLNHDGWVDEADMEAFANGERP